MGKGDFSHLSFQEICELCKNISRGKGKYGRSPQDLVTAREIKLSMGLVSQTELNNLLNILGNLNEQIDMLRMQNKQKVKNVASFIFYLNAEINMLCMNVHLTTLKFVKYVQEHILINIFHHYHG